MKYIILIFMLLLVGCESNIGIDPGPVEPSEEIIAKIEEVRYPNCERNSDCLSFQFCGGNECKYLREACEIIAMNDYNMSKPRCWYFKEGDCDCEEFIVVEEEKVKERENSFEVTEPARYDVKNIRFIIKNWKELEE